MRIHREGTGILLTSLAILLIINLVSWYFVPVHLCNVVLTTFSVLLYLLMVNFFRSPKRHFEGDVENLVIAPADGRVVVVEKVFEPDHFKAERIMVSIFMSPMNVHANWYPVEGTVVRVEHQSGCFHKAWLPKASTENERSLVVLKALNDTCTSGCRRNGKAHCDVCTGGRGVFHRRAYGIYKIRFACGRLSAA